MVCLTIRSCFFHSDRVLLIQFTYLSYIGKFMHQLFINTYPNILILVFSLDGRGSVVSLMEDTHHRMNFKASLKCLRLLIVALSIFISVFRTIDI